MAWSDDDYITSFDAEAGEIASLATSALKILWFNEGQTRLLRRRARYEDVTWVEGDREIPLPGDFVQLDRVVVDFGTSHLPWKVWGTELVLDDEQGALRDGSARVFYWAEFEPMTTATTATELSLSQDYACLYYALSRFYRRLSSNRAYYKRYATLVGQNAVTMTDLQQEADRYYQDFLEARQDLEPEAPSFFYDS